MASRPCALHVIWDPKFNRYDFGPDHPFSERSRGLAVRLLEESRFFALGVGGPVEIHDAPVASSDELRRFHEADYLAFVARRSDEEVPGPLDSGDTPAFPGCYEAAARVAGGTLLGWHIVREAPEIHAFNPAGGLHHARPDRASGFCIFNDPALAIRAALQPGTGIGRVAYVDIDVHHGDGVMYGFYDDGRVLDIDFHQDGRTIFPGTGALHETGRGDGSGLKVNIPLPPGVGDEAFLPIFETIVPPLLRRFRPELIVVQTGVDAHVGDRLGNLQYTPRAYVRAITRVHELAHELSGGRLLVTGGGGYNAGNVARILARTAAVLAGRVLPAREEEETPVPWQKEFAAAMGESAPKTWGAIPAVRPSPWRREKEERILGELSRSLGRSFP